MDLKVFTEGESYEKDKSFLCVSCKCYAVVGCGSNETIDNGVDVENTTQVPTDSADLGGAVDSDNETPASTTSSGDYFSSARLKREQTRLENKTMLMDLLDDASVTEEQKNIALEEIVALSESAEIENATELLLKAKGFDDAVVIIVGGSVDVIINAPALTDGQIAQIEDIVVRKTGISAEKIVISVVVPEE